MSSPCAPGMNNGQELLPREEQTHEHQQLSWERECSQPLEGPSSSGHDSLRVRHQCRADTDERGEALIPGSARAAYTVQTPGGTPSFSRNMSTSDLNASQSMDMCSAMTPLDVPSIWERLRTSHDDPAVEDHFHLHLHTSFDSFGESPRNSAASAHAGGNSDSPFNDQHGTSLSGDERVGRASEPTDMASKDRSPFSNDIGVERGDWRTQSRDEIEQMRMPPVLPPNVAGALEDSRRKRSELLERCERHRAV